MKTLSSRLMLRVSIGVTSVAILSILANVFTSIVLGKPLNSPGYYALVIGLGAASAILGLFQVLPKLSAYSRENEELQSYITSFDAYGKSVGWDSNDVRTQQQDHPVKVTMEINGTPITIESPDVGKIEDIMRHLTQSIQASNPTEASASQIVVRENKETYKVEDNPK